jgi:hypothetical protein
MNYKSIAKITSISQIEKNNGLDFWSNPPSKYIIKGKKLNAVKLVREDREDVK